MNSAEGWFVRVAETNRYAFEDGWVEITIPEGVADPKQIFVFARERKGVFFMEVPDWVTDDYAWPTSWDDETSAEYRAMQRDGLV